MIFGAQTYDSGDAGRRRVAESHDLSWPRTLIRQDASRSRGIGGQNKIRTNDLGVMSFNLTVTPRTRKRHHSGAFSVTGNGLELITYGRWFQSYFSSGGWIRTSDLAHFTRLL
jgi:hypothetical protein